MGYMGFGMQRWIYTMKSRKPFQKRSKKYDMEAENIETQDFFDTKDRFRTGQKGAAPTFTAKGLKRFNKNQDKMHLKTLIIYIIILMICSILIWILRGPV